MNEWYTLDEVTSILNITADRIKFYEKRGLVVHSTGKKNKYNLNDIVTLQSILFYRSLGLNLDVIEILLENDEEKNYLSKFNSQAKLLDSEIHRLSEIQKSLDLLKYKINGETNDAILEPNLIKMMKKSNLIKSINLKKKVDLKFKNETKKQKSVVKSAFMLVIGVGFLTATFNFLNSDSINAITAGKIKKEKVVTENKISEPVVIERAQTTTEPEINPEINSDVNSEGNVTPETQVDLSSEYLLISNKNNPIGESYVPPDLVVPNIDFQDAGNYMVKYLRQEAATALENLFNSATESGIYLIGISGYRSYDYQVTVYNNEIYNEGIDEAEEYVAKPGESEHQLGLAIDVLSTEYSSLDEGFENTESFKWLQENMSKFGFILRYPKGKEAITGYGYEPWHLRYVGIEHAAKIMDRNLTLEEYMNQQ